jgi:high-affinity Fe2+/Pb2+ permease
MGSYGFSHDRRTIVRCPRKTLSSTLPTPISPNANFKFLIAIIFGLTLWILQLPSRLLSQIDPQWHNLCWGDHDSCLLGETVWDLGKRLPDSQFPGLLIKALFCYTQHLDVLQTIGYVAFMGIIGGRYWKSLNS